MSKFEEIRFEEAGEDGVAVLVMNRPEKRNAIGLTMVDEIHEVLSRLERPGTAGALVITGAGGKVFAAGADIAELRDRTPEDHSPRESAVAHRRRGFRLGPRWWL
jgi:enoyl-CoA hydratase